MFLLDRSSYGSLESLQDVSLSRSDVPQTLCRSVPTVKTAYKGSQTLAVEISDPRDKNRKRITLIIEKNQALR